MKKLLLTIFAIITISIIAMIGATSTSAETRSGTTGDCTWSLDGTVLTISGNGAMGSNFASFSFVYLPWGHGITEVIIEDGVTKIGDYAFWDCGSLTSITIPDSVTSIGDDAFEDCLSLTSITIPDSVTSIGDNAFYNCTSLKSITIPDSVTSIGFGSFAECTSLASITIGESVTSIDNDAFYNCNSLASVYIKSSIVAKYSGSHASRLFSFTNTMYVDEKITEVGECVYGTFSCKLSGFEYEGTTYNRYYSTHNYDNDCDALCNDCSWNRTVMSHAYKSAWSKDSGQHWRECSICSSPGRKTAHQFGNEMDKNCDICGYTRQVQQVQNESNNKGSNSLDNTTVIIIVIGTAVLVVGGGVLIGIRKKK